jgi:hypothetical protein
MGELGGLFFGFAPWSRAEKLLLKADDTAKIVFLFGFPVKRDEECSGYPASSDGSR